MSRMTGIIVLTEYDMEWRATAYLKGLPVKSASRLSPQGAISAVQIAVTTEHGAWILWAIHSISRKKKQGLADLR